MARRCVTTMVAALALTGAALSAGCGSGLSESSTASSAGGDSAATSSDGAAHATSATQTSTSSTATRALPGSGKPQIVLGDKNFTEQFVLGELYKQALEAQGYDVALNRNIGPTEVTIPAVESGRVDIYPEYLSTWVHSVAGLRRTFADRRQAYLAGQRFALANGLQLLNPSPFTDTQAIAVTRAYARAHDLHTLADLGRVGGTLVLGGPPQFQQDPAGLPAIESVYGFSPLKFTALGVGGQYQALDQGTVQAAEVSTTDGELASGRYVLLRDPLRVFWLGNVVPVVSARALLAEGPAFADTIDRVDALLSTGTMRRLNAAVDVAHEDPAAVAKAFLVHRGFVPPSS